MSTRSFLFRSVSGRLPFNTSGTAQPETQFQLPIFLISPSSTQVLPNFAMGGGHVRTNA
jgi:hypothetical protein